MLDGRPDLLILRHLEGSLSLYEEELLIRMLQRGGAVADRFVEFRELERGLAEVYGGRRALTPCGGPADVPVGSSRVRRFTTGPSGPAEPSWPSGVVEAYRRWLSWAEPSAHRGALAHCLGLLSDEIQDVLRCRHSLGLSSRELAAHLARALRDVEGVLCRVESFLAGCVRLRLSRRVTPPFSSDS